MIIDAHFHCWQLARGDYGWLQPMLAPIYRDVRVADWLAQASPLGVGGGVLVQAAPTEAETHFLLQQAEVNPVVLGVVGWTDLLTPDAPERIRALALRPRLKGLRPMLHDIVDERWILQPALAPALEAMADSGLVLDALVRPAHLPHILTLAGRYPELQIVIDHAAKPEIAAQHWQPWADWIARIAAETTAVCKLSGMLTEAARPPKQGAVRPWAEHVLACFGPSRVIWGSDWPVLELAATYASWWNETQELLRAWLAADRAAVMGRNAERVYGLCEGARQAG
jgi:L-fuconolactonase